MSTASKPTNIRRFDEFNLQIHALHGFGSIIKDLSTYDKLKCNQSEKKLTFLNRTLHHIHLQKSFQNLNESNQNQNVFTISRLIWNQTNVRLA